MKLTLFKETDFINAVKALFKELKVPVNYVADEPTTAKKILKDTYKDNLTFNLIDDVYFVGMVDDAAFEGNESLSTDKIKSDYDGILIFGITLNQRENNLLPTRSQLAEISRAFNREFYYTPVVLVFKYRDDTNEYIAFASTERLKYKQEWREGEKAGKVSLLRDINITNPHSGHERILFGDGTNKGLRINNKIDSFSKLYNYWQEVFNVSILNKKFYKELQNWYFWAIKHVRFPNEPTQEDAIKKEVKLEDLIQEHNATNVIRLLTRLLFAWFIKEKGLIPDELFDLYALQKDILKDISPYHEENSLFKGVNKESIYYKAILQNLFFATLNCPIKSDVEDNRSRGFRGLETYGKHRGIDWMMRYKKYFKNPDAFLEMVNKVVPFLNGGLFECLDDKTQNLYIDGFSDQMTKGEHLIVPDYLFFGATENVDLSADYGVKNKQAKQAAVKGLINILKSYKFTITENTPIEEDVALDPELLGKVFENLLASYNPETKTTARKQTGSFYTPREIVNYMVDESLIAYLKNVLEASSLNVPEASSFGKVQGTDALDTMLHQLVSFDNINPFAKYPKVAKQIVYALDRVKILDPAAGSGAFPMGVLQKMVHILQKLDPTNEMWKEVQLEKAMAQTKDAYNIEDKKEREQKLIEINNAFDEQVNDPDFARKLYLIENCIYGVDIQPIATQISKLRFFISLVVDQKVQPEKPNFGIRPLPNLETKFVTANTLIDIEKPERMGSLFGQKKIKELEKDLKSIRHKLFSAKSKDTKVKYRKKDKELREKLSELIEIELNKEIDEIIKNDKRFAEIKYLNGLIERNGEKEDYLKKIKQLKNELNEIKNTFQSKNHKTAQQLSSWDPYDQNASSPFFDPEWMFDIKDGFDIVIGNPPYISTRTKDFDRSLLPLYKKLFKLAVGQFDLYNLFFEKSEQILNKLGTLTFIVPKRLLSNENFEPLRLHLLNKLPIHKYVDAEMPFEAAVVEANVVVCERIKPNNVDIFIRTKQDFKYDKSINYESIQKFPFRIFPFVISQVDIGILEKINSVSNNTFGDYLQITRGFECGFNHPSIGKIGEDLIVRGEHIKPYKVIEPEYRVTPDFNNSKVFKTKELFKKTPKLLTKFVSNTLDFAIDNYGYYNTNTIYNIHCKKENCNLYSILILGNSKLLNYWFFNTYVNDDNVFPHIQKNQLESIPIKNDSIIDQLELFGRLLENTYNQVIKIVTDAIVFNLYFPDHMKERGIDVLEFVERDYTESLRLLGVDYQKQDALLEQKQDAFDILSDTEKEQVIEQLHQKWTDPNNEVVKRMSMFKEKSPDILKVIMES